MVQQDNLAHQRQVAIPSQQPKPTSIPQSTPIHINRPTTRKVSVTRLEKAVCCLFSILVFGLSYLNISSGSEVNTLNQSYQDTRTEIELVEVQNSNLKQQTQELSRYDRIFAIAKELGLEINEENVRNVGK